LGYTLIVENRGNAVAEDVTVECSTTGNLKLDRERFQSVAISPSNRESYIVVAEVRSSYSLDQNLKVKIAWKYREDATVMMSPSTSEK